ncbi:MAG TPA: BTAD domain-containing putative transcriptional regulator, partial [Acidimicrobiales bacterium]|nr:BTAD domain-containing putative transcriptional regulator [Acidimicrobiales bacterium]
MLRLRVVGVSVLGPLRVDSADGALSPRDRVVLAALAVRAGTPVPSDVLADALWGDAPPTSWNKVVQGCVVRLRRLLGPSSIVTETSGYVLALPPEEVDARHFERLVARGSELLALGDPERAWSYLGEALALWRGRPLPELDRWDPGRIESDRLEELRRDAEEAHVDAALRAGRHREVLAAARALVDEAPTRERRWAMLALAQYRDGQQGDALRTLHHARAVLARELGIEPGAELAELELAILRQDPELATPPAPGEASDVCPWPGLVAFDVDDADAFFGREDDVEACMRRLRADGVLVVVGPSGSGKSSLVRAGVAAALRRDGSTVHIITPAGSRPADVVPRVGMGDVLVVDQCEQAMRPGVPHEERRRFLDGLVHHARRGWLVVALRADRTGELSWHEDFARLVERGLHLLGPLDESALRRAIEAPARRAALRLEPGLIDVVVRDVLDEPGALPLMSHALRETWARREGRTLTAAAYRETGGIRAAVAMTAEELYDDIGVDRRERLRDLMVRLVVPSEGGDPVPARMPLAVIAADPAYDQLVEELVRARLLTCSEGDVQLAHECLPRAWPRLQSWLDEDQAGLRLLRHVATTAAGWDAMGRPDSELYRGTRLAAAADWRMRASPKLTEVEAAFLDASEALSAIEVEAADVRARQQATANRRLRVLLAGAAVLAVVALVAGLLAARQADRADRQARAATARELAAAAVANLPVDPERSILLALAAIEETGGPDGTVVREAQEALHHAVHSSRIVHRIPQGGGELAVTADGSRVVTVPERPAERHATVWSTRTGEALLRLRGPQGPWGAVAIDPHDRLAATSHGDGAVRVWDLSGGELVRTIDVGAPNLPVAFTDDGTVLATGVPGGVVRWDLATGARIGRFGGPTPVVLAATAAGSRFAATSHAGDARIWEPAGGIRPLVGHIWPVTD